jgi:hypothetical protein
MQHGWISKNAYMTLTAKFHENRQRDLVAEGKIISKHILQKHTAETQLPLCQDRASETL